MELPVSGGEGVHDPVDRLEGNMGAVVRALRSSIAFWESLPLSVAGRIALLKMVTLPRLFHFFGALPMWIPGNIFRELESEHCIHMGNRKEKVTLHTLQQPTKDGGLEVADFEAYYLAAQLQWYTQWVAHRLDPDQVGSCDIPNLLY